MEEVKKVLITARECAVLHVVIGCMLLFGTWACYGAAVREQAHWLVQKGLGVLGAILFGHCSYFLLRFFLFGEVLEEMARIGAAVKKEGE